LGDLTVAASDRGVTALTMAGQKYEKRHLDRAEGPGGEEVLRLAEAWLARYFSGRDPGALPPLDPAGTVFQTRVWRLLAGIPLGRTMTYGQIAERLGTSPRAVGSAVGRNPVSILIPCHRVVGADGSFKGYAGGPERKRWLLNWEKQMTKPDGSGR